MLESSGDPAKICGVVSTLDVSEPGVWDGPDGDGRVARKGPRPGEGFDVDDTKKKSGGRHVCSRSSPGIGTGERARSRWRRPRAAAPAGVAVRVCVVSSSLSDVSSTADVSSDEWTMRAVDGGRTLARGARRRGRGRVDRRGAGPTGMRTSRGWGNLEFGDRRLDAGYGSATGRAGLGGADGDDRGGCVDAMRRCLGLVG